MKCVNGAKCTRKAGYYNDECGCSGPDCIIKIEGSPTGTQILVGGGGSVGFHTSSDGEVSRSISIHTSSDGEVTRSISIFLNDSRNLEQLIAISTKICNSNF